MDKKKKTILVVAIAILIALPLGGFIIAKVFIIPPSSREVCEQVRKLMLQKYKDEGMEDTEAEGLVTEIFGPVENCIKEEDKDRENKGLLEIRKDGKCIMGAENFDELEKCETRDD